MTTTCKQKQPQVSFAIPVRNGEKFIGKLLDSILAQTFQDFEIVISDNVSTDRTLEILAEYSARDPRIRYFQNESNIGQIENFNRVFDLTCGKYVRWIGCDDWLEPEYTEDSVNALDSHPEWIGVTTYIVMHHENGPEQRFEYKGERLESEDISRRFSRLMWLLSKGLMYMSLLSAMLRRDALVRVGGFGIEPDTDFVMCARLVLDGSFGHVPEHHVNRRRPLVTPAVSLQERYEQARRYHPTKYKDVVHNYWRSCRKIVQIIWSCDLNLLQKAQCTFFVWRFYLKKLPWKVARSTKAAIVSKLPRDSWVFRKLNRASPKD